MGDTTMKTTPSELTPELLSLLLGNKDVNDIVKIDNNELFYYHSLYGNYTSINIDTLTRLMIEYCLKHGYAVIIIAVDTKDWQVQVSIEGEPQPKKWVCTLSHDDVFEATLKALIWVRSEGL